MYLSNNLSQHEFGIALTDEPDELEVNWPLPQEGLSTLLNGVVFNDGLKASERQWTIQNSNYTSIGSSFLQGFAQRLTTTSDQREQVRQREEELKWQGEEEELQRQREEELRRERQDQDRRLKEVRVTFKPIPLQYHSHFKREPRFEKSAVIDISITDGKRDVVDRALEKLAIPYYNGHYDLHIIYGHRDEHVGMVESTYLYYASFVRSNQRPEFTIQNTLWETCRHDHPELSTWKRFEFTRVSN
jgi:hypothetical protein